MSTNNNALTTVKSTELFATEFVGVTLDPTLTKGLLKSSPNLYKTGNTLFLDYSSTANSSDLKLLKRFFNKVVVGNTFNISGGTYYNPTTHVQYNFQGIYEISGITGNYNQFLYFKGISYNTSLPNGIYNNHNFKTVINYDSNKGNTAQYLLSKFNNEDPYNFSFLGIYGNDFNSEEYIEVEGSTLNPNRYKIDNSIKLNDGSEAILLNSENSISNENMFFERKTINLLMRQVPDLNTLSQSKYQNGIVKKINTDKKTIDVLSEQNLHQRYSRMRTDSNHYYDWYPIINTENFKNVLNPYAYDRLSISINYYSFIKIGIVTLNDLTNLATGAGISTTNSTAIYVDNIATTVKVYKAQTIGNLSIPTIKLDLSDSSLYGWIISAFYDEACSIPLNAFYYLNGVPGFEGCSFLFLSNVAAPNSFYLKFEKNQVLKLLITI